MADAKAVKQAARDHLLARAAESDDPIRQVEAKMDAIEEDRAKLLTELRAMAAERDALIAHRETHAKATKVVRDMPVEHVPAYMTAVAPGWQPAAKG